MKKKNLSAKKKIHNFYLKKLEDPRIRNVYLTFKQSKWAWSTKHDQPHRDRGGENVK